MKRKDLKAGEFYCSDYRHHPDDRVHLFLSGPETGDQGFFVDVHLVNGCCDGIWSTDSEREVTPCDPPAWFSEVWVRREPEEDRYMDCGCVLCACSNEYQCYGCGAGSCDEHDIGNLKAKADAWREEVARRKGGSDE